MYARIGPLLVAVVVVTALGAAAATVDTATRGGGLGMLDGPEGSLSGGPSMDTDGQVDRPWLSPGPAAATPGEAAASLVRRIVVPLVALAVLIVGALLVVRRATGDDDRLDPDTDADAAAADADATEPWRPTPRDEVAAAWWALISRTDGADRRTATPGELADRAVAAGFPAAPVRDLTALFDRVRYGGAAPTDDRVAEAQSTLARATGGGDGGSQDEPDGDDAAATPEDVGDGH
jgi:hypothetical protein